MSAWREAEFSQDAHKGAIEEKERERENPIIKRILQA